MTKEELTALVAEILNQSEPPVKASDYHPTQPLPEKPETAMNPGDFVEDVTKLDLRKLYLVEDAENGEKFRSLKEKTSARLGCGRAGARYKTLTLLRFRADHAAARDAVFSQVPEAFAEENGLIAVKTSCRDKEQYLTRPDLGRCFDEETRKKIADALPGEAPVQIIVGDGLSASAILANAMDCLQAIRQGLEARGVDPGPVLFVRYCRVGAGDAVGDVTRCRLACVLVGERPGLTTDESMSVYLTYAPRTGVSESSRTVVSNIHAQGTPAVEAGAHVAELIAAILEQKASGVGLEKRP